MIGVGGGFVVPVGVGFIVPKEGFGAPAGLVPDIVVEDETPGDVEGEANSIEASMSTLDGSEGLDSPMRGESTWTCARACSRALDAEYSSSDSSRSSDSGEKKSRRRPRREAGRGLSSEMVTV